MKQVRSWLYRFAVAYLALLVAIAALAPMLANKKTGLLIRHDPGVAEPFARLLPPGAPTLRVLPLGGSDAADQLGLMQVQSQGEGVYLGQPAELDADSHVPAQFAIVTASLQRCVFQFAGLDDFAHVAAQIEMGSNGLVNAAYDKSSQRFTLRDLSTPVPAHLLGTDRHGADVAAGMVHAARTAILVALVATAIAIVLGVFIGTLMGALGGWCDFIGLRLIEIASAVPRLLLLVIVASAMSAAYSHHMLFVLMATIGATSWMTPARLLRGELIRVREQEFVLAARAVGTPRWRVIAEHMLPAAIVPVLVEATFYMSAAVLIETNLSFLGLGVRPPGTSWGAMLADAVDRSTGAFHWWLAIGPGAMVFLTVFSIQTVGEHLRRKLGTKPSWIT